MATHAIFAIRLYRNKYYSFVLGTVHDGFHYNLEYLAHLVIETARGIEVLTQLRQRDFDAVKKVFQAIAEYSDFGWFTDYIQNSSFVSYSAIFDPKTSKLELYDGCLDGLVKTIQVPKKAKTFEAEGKQIAKKWKQQNHLTPVKKLNSEP